jgi:uncharacterized repeat protein (TIGR01451 family)
VRDLSKIKWISMWATVLSLFFIGGWQSTPPLSIAVAVDPQVASAGETLAFAFTVSNVGNAPLADVVVRVRVPEGTERVRAGADADEWTVERPSVGTGDAIAYRAKGPLAPGSRAHLVLVVLVRKGSGQSIVLDDYEATAKGLAAPVVGAATTVWVDVTPTPTPKPTSTPTTAPSPTAMPSPTITIVPGVLLPTVTPTPTPNLSSEQVRVGTVTVSVFVTIVVASIALSVAWMVRNGKRAPNEGS